MIDYIEIVNVQTIVDFRFEFPEEGIVKFSGDNNDGKSIVRKVFYDVIGCQLHIKDNRYCLINDDKDYAIFRIHKASGEQLEAYIHRESAKTYYELTVPGEPPIRRYIKDKHLDTLVYDSNFHYLAKREFSLNCHPANTPNLFETTSSLCNKEVYDSATEDPMLNLAIENVKNVVVEIKDNKMKATNNMAIELSKINSSILVDETAEMKRVLGMQKIKKGIESIYPIELVALIKPPTIKNIRVLEVESAKTVLTNFKVPNNKINVILNQLKALKEIQILTDASETMKEFIKNKEARDAEVCVVCGRKVFDNEHCEV